MAMHIVDPLNPSNDLGKHLRASDLQRMFRGAYIGLHSKVAPGAKLRTMFDTKKILM